MFGFLGITDVRFVRAEGMAMGEQSRATGLTDAQRAIKGIGANAANQASLVAAA